MQNRTRRHDPVTTAIGILVVLAMFVLLSSPIFWLIMFSVVVFLVFIAYASWMLFGKNYVRPRPVSQAGMSEAEAAALQAMQRAGYGSRNRRIRSLALADIGLLVYEGTTHPRISRNTDVPTSATHIRPYVVLYQPIMPNSSGYGGVQLDLRDHDGTLRYTSDETYTLKPGKNFVTPPTWLPLHNQPTEDGWTLEVRVGDTLIGVHAINWLQIGGATRAQFNDEGEIDPRARRWKELDFDEPLSLEDLLAEQAREAKRASQV
ncbi:MAG: hypothetical protein IT324_04955 [Anaerolineae bacterium]|nr:hypothetical protein [Anaerolineae bacterium]